MKDKEIQELLAASDSAIKLLKQKISELEAETGALTNESSNLTLECILKDKWIADLEAKYNAQAQEAGNLFLDATERANYQESLANYQKQVAGLEDTIKEKNGNLITLMKAYEAKIMGINHLHCADLDLTELLTRLNLNNLSF